MICTLFGNFRAYVLAPCGISTLDLTKYGSWSGNYLIKFNMAYIYTIVITGGSEGIGRGYALEVIIICIILVSLMYNRWLDDGRGLNVVILSRSQEKLSKVEEEISMFLL